MWAIFVEAIDMNNRNRNHSFYLSAKWKHKRERVMRHYKYEDQEAKRYGHTVTATLIHHIYPLDKYPELGMETWNLLPLSNATHNKMHDRYTDDITANGIYWQRKRKKEFDKFKSENNFTPAPSKK